MKNAKLGQKHTKIKYLYHALAFLLPAVILTLVLRVMGFYPFGERSLLIMDMNDQYVHFFSSLKGLFSGDTSLFFSWEKGMGQNYIGLFAYYLASPLSFITVLFSTDTLPLGILLLTIIKISLCGVTLSIYLDKAFDENRAFKLYFTTAYALMSYNLVYSLSLMWLDAVILLPLILCGIEYIIRKGRGTLFILSIAAVFICNYYLAFSVSVFCVMYYFYRWFWLHGIKETKALWQNFVKIALSALAGIGLSAWLIVPTVVDLTTKGAGWENPETFNFPFMDIFRKLTPNFYDSIMNGGLPAIFCGVGVTCLAIAFFFNPKIVTKAKVMAGAIIGLFVVSFWVVPLDEVWHGFQTPNWFPYRYAFLFSFFMVFMAYMQFAHMEIRLKPVFKSAICIFLIFLLSCTMYHNSKVMLMGLDREFTYKKFTDYKDFCDETSGFLSEVTKDTEGLFRVEKDYEYSKNDSMLLGYHGITHFSSHNNKNINTFTKNAGMAQAFFWNSYFGSTPVTDSILGVKYIMAKSERSEEFYTEKKHYNSKTLYKNDYVLPMGFVADRNMDMGEFSSANPFKNQNVLIECLSGIEQDIFYPIEYRKKSNAKKTVTTITFTAPNSEPVYLYMDGEEEDVCEVYVNDIFHAHYFTRETKINLYLGTFAPGEEVEIEVKALNNKKVPLTTMFLQYLDTAAYKDSIAKLQKEAFYDVQKKSTGLSANIDTEKESLVFTSIPRTKGFSVKINGKKAETSAYMDTYLSFVVPAGTSHIEIRFVSPGFYTGLALSTGTAIILLFLLGKKRKKIVFSHENS